MKSHKKIITVPPVLRWLPFIIAVAILLIAALVIIGWIFDFPTLYRISPELPPMMPGTAISLMLLGWTLLFVQPNMPPYSLRRARWVSLGGIFIGLFFLCGFFCEYPQTLINDLARYLGRPLILLQRTSPHTAAAITLSSLGLFLLSLQRPRLAYAAHVLGFIVVIALTIVFLGYAHNEQVFFALPHGVGMSLYTASAFVLLAWGIILTRVECGFMRVLLSSGGGGTVARRGLFTIANIPILLGWLPTLLRSTILTTAEIESILATFLVLASMIVIIKLAYQVDRQEEIQKEVEETEHQHQNDLTHMARVYSMGEMATGIAHELNQPLTAISNYTAACQRLKFDDEDAERLEQGLAAIRKQVDRASGIIRSLRAMVQKQSPKMTRVRVAEVIDEALQLIQPEMGRLEVEFTVELDKPLPYVMADAVQIEQVLLNLFKNAAEAMSDLPATRRLIMIRAFLNEKDSIQIDVHDNGIGMGKAQLENIFEAFVTTKKEHGMGIGLSLCRSIIEAHNGRLWAESEPQQGSTFSFTLPVSVGNPDEG